MSTISDHGFEGLRCAASRASPVLADSFLPMSDRGVTDVLCWTTEGVMVAADDAQAFSHMELKDVPNLQVMKLMQSLTYAAPLSFFPVSLAFFEWFSVVAIAFRSVSSHLSVI